MEKPFGISDQRLRMETATRSRAPECVEASGNGILDDNSSLIVEPFDVIDPDVSSLIELDIFLRHSMEAGSTATEDVGIQVLNLRDFCSIEREIKLVKPVEDGAHTHEQVLQETRFDGKAWVETQRDPANACQASDSESNFPTGEASGSKQKSIITLGNPVLPFQLEELPSKKACFQGSGGLPAECVGDPAKYYLSMEYLWTLLRENRISLISGSWLLKRSKADPFVPLPSCQDLPLDARVDPQRLKIICDVCIRWMRRKRIYPVVAISHCWLNPNHPDPDGFLLQELAPVLEVYIQEIVEAGRSKVLVPQAENALKELADIGGAFFFAWCSLYQPYHKRVDGTYQWMEDLQLTPAQQQAHHHGLERMDLWYTHAHTAVWMLTKYFHGQGKKYDDRGWTTWERTVANLLSDADAVLDIGKVGGTCIRSMDEVRDACKSARTPPLSCDGFNKLITTKHFTCGESDRDLIRTNYARNFVHALNCVRDFEFCGMRWCTSDFASLFSVLQHCKELRTLILGSNHIGDAGARGLAEGLQHCKNLERLNLSDNQIGDAGARELAAGLQYCENLEMLNLFDNQIGDAGARELAAGLQHCGNLARLKLGGNQIGDAGARTLADSLQDFWDLVELYLNGNQIGDAGARGLAEGLQHCGNLNTLDLSENQIGDAGARELAAGLQHCEYLHRLHLNGNQIGNAGARELAAGLRHCRNLAWLHLNGNQIDAAGSRELAEGLQRQLRGICVEMEGLGSSNCPWIASRLDHTY